MGHEPFKDIVALGRAHPGDAEPCINEGGLMSGGPYRTLVISRVTARRSPKYLGL